MHFLQLGLTVHGVGIDVDLGIQAMQVAIGLDDQRIDFQQGQVVVLEEVTQTDKNIDELLDLRAFEAKLEGQLAALVWHRANQRVDDSLEDFLRGFVGNLFNLHAAFGGCHEHNALAGTIHHRTQVQLPGNISAGFNQNLVDGLTAGICLVSHQALTEPLVGEIADFVLGFDQLHTTRLATTTGMHLSLDNPLSTTDLVCCDNSFFSSFAGIAFGYRQAILSKQLLALIFM